MMSLDLLEQSLGQLACDIPGATRTFHHYNLAFCCAGQKSFREAALGKDLKPLLIAADLRTLQYAGELAHAARDEPQAPFIAHIPARTPQRCEGHKGVSACVSKGSD